MTTNPRKIQRFQKPAGELQAGLHRLGNRGRGTEPDEPRGMIAVLGACEFLEQCDMLYATYEDPSGSIHPTMKTYRPTERTQEFMNAIKQSLDRKISD